MEGAGAASFMDKPARTSGSKANPLGIMPLDLTPSIDNTLWLSEGT